MDDLRSRASYIDFPKLENQYNSTPTPPQRKAPPPMTPNEIDYHLAGALRSSESMLNDLADGVEAFVKAATMIAALEVHVEAPYLSAEKRVALIKRNYSHITQSLLSFVRDEVLLSRLESWMKTIEKGDS